MVFQFCIGRAALSRASEFFKKAGFPLSFTKGMFNISEPSCLIQATGRVLVEVWFEEERLFTLVPF